MASTPDLLLGSQVVSFVPPDAEFELMNYRTSDNIQLPFRVLPSVSEPSRNRVEVRTGC